MNRLQIVFEEQPQDSCWVDELKGTGKIIVYIHDYEYGKTNNCIDDQSREWIHDLLEVEAPSADEECESTYEIDITELEAIIPKVASVVAWTGYGLSRQLTQSEIKRFIDIWR